MAASTCHHPVTIQTKQNPNYHLGVGEVLCCVSAREAFCLCYSLRLHVSGAQEAVFNKHLSLIPKKFDWTKNIPTSEYELRVIYEASYTNS